MKLASKEQKILVADSMEELLLLSSVTGNGHSSRIIPCHNGIGLTTMHTVRGKNDWDIYFYKNIEVDTK